MHGRAYAVHMLPMLTLAQVAEKLSTPVKTVRLWVGQGRLPAFKPGRQHLVKPADLEAFVEASAVGAPKPLVKDGARRGKVK